MHSNNLITKNEKLFVSTFFSSIAGVIDAGDKHSFTNISANFHKNSNFFNGILRGTIHEKPEAKNLVSDSLLGTVSNNRRATVGL